MRRRAPLAIALAVSLFAAARWALPQAPDPLDPIRAAPDTHKLSLENAFVRVLEVRIPPGKVEPRHRHPHGLSVYLTDWTARVTVDGGQPQVQRRRAGTYAWSEALVHTVENAGSTEAHVFRIELKF